MTKGPFTIFHLDDGKELRGGQRQLLYLAKELSTLGHDNVIVCRKNSPLELRARGTGLETRTLPYFFEWDPVSAFLLGKIAKPKTAKRPLPVILHSHTSHTAAHAWMASHGLNCLRIAHRRADFPPGGGISTKLKYTRADRVIAISRPVQETLISAGVPPEKISLVHSSIDLSSPPWKEQGMEAYRASSRAKISAGFGIKKDAFWTGALIALEPCKDPCNFIRAAFFTGRRGRAPRQGEGTRKNPGH